MLVHARGPLHTYRGCALLVGPLNAWQVERLGDAKGHIYITHSHALRHGWYRHS